MAPAPELHFRGRPIDLADTVNSEYYGKGKLLNNASGTYPQMAVNVTSRVN